MLITLLRMPAAPTLSMPRQLLAVARDIKLSHTVFALPFALLAMFLAAGWMGRLPKWGEAGLILLCMVTARTFAMAFNRWADARIDAANTRTASRAVPSGRVSRGMMLSVVIASAVGFIASAWGFRLAYRNDVPVVLSPLVLAVLAGYSLTKRFTWLCHVTLGVALALSPIAAALAIEPLALSPDNSASCWGPNDSAPEIWLLACMVLCWVAGFDILYALQDTEADRQLGLYSIPSRLGVGTALWISRTLHTLSAAALVGTALLADQLGPLFMGAAALTCALLLLEHALVAGGTTKRLNMAFFTVNGVISLLLGATGIFEIVTA